MFDALRNTALRILKVPPEPQPPVGDPASLRVFRAGRKYYRLRMAEWALAEVAALLVFLFWTAVLIDVEVTAHARRTELAARSSAEAAPAAGTEGVPETTPQADEDPASGEPAKASGAAEAQPEPQNLPERIAAKIRAAAEIITHKAETQAPRSVGQWITTSKQFLVELALQLPEWMFPLVWVLKIGGFIIYLAQIPITYSVRRLDYEMRWYMVTDRSLRLRHGVWRVTESTMSFANIQQVAVNQGPLQRLLGLADVKVQSAGGGGGAGKEGKTSDDDDDMHLGLFRHVTNATEIRDLILDRLRHYRQTGLGDPDERVPAAAAASHGAIASEPAGSRDALAAAQELLAEARALRKAI